MANPYASGSWLNIPAGYNIASLEPDTSMLPEDSETDDAVEIAKLIGRYFETQYPKFEPQVISTMDKEYYLPALKVLVNVNGKYFSPGYESEWKDMELHAECRDENKWGPSPVVASFMNSKGAYVGGGYSISPIEQSTHRHEAPDEKCDCGIYGSVHLEELKRYLVQKTKFELASQLYSFDLDDIRDMEVMMSNRPPRNRPANKLCIIEPTPDAKVILCRKGWKASHAFISEIVGETIPVNVASNLLSIAWHRPVDVARLYENR